MTDDHQRTDDEAANTSTDADGESGADETDVSFVLVAAIAENRVIGADGGMPWHYPRDLAHFKTLTTGHPVVLGRITYESIIEQIDEPLPDRTSIVLTTRDLDPPDDVVVAGGVDEATALGRRAATNRDVETVYVVGGASVYEAFLSLADRMVLTEVPERPDGDTRFPAWDDDVWEETARESDGDLAFVTYDRVE